MGFGLHPFAKWDELLEDNAVTQRAYRPTRGIDAAFKSMRALHDVTNVPLPTQSAPVDALWFLRIASRKPRRSSSYG